MSTITSNPAFFRHTTEVNIARAKLCATIATLIETTLLLRNFIIYGISLHYYVLLYLFLIFISVGLYGALIFIEKRNDDASYKLAYRLIFLYHFLTLLWGVTLALLDQNSYGHVTAYLINLLITATFFITSRKAFISLHIIPLIAFFGGLYYFFPQSPYNSGHIINISIFFVFVYIGTGFIFSYTKKTYEQERTLNAQNDELNALNTHLEQLANKDALTNLYNRHYLNRYIEKQQGQAEHIAIWVIDVDHFKAYNDHYGHLMGDDALKKVASAMQKVASEHDLLPVRLGGEEFLLVGFEYSLEQAAIIAEQMRSAIEQMQVEHVASPTNCVLTASIGYMIDRFEHSQQFTTLLNKADEALYISKQQGRNRTTTLQYETQ